MSLVTIFYMPISRYSSLGQNFPRVDPTIIQNKMDAISKFSLDIEELKVCSRESSFPIQWSNISNGT